jgi:outer membrane protein TolC
MSSKFTPMKTSIKYLTLLALLSWQAPEAIAQHALTLNDAVQLAIEHNPGLQSGKLDIEKSRQRQVVARSAFLPAIQASAQLNHFFQLPPFFGFGETNGGDKIPYGRFGGEDQFSTYLSAVQPLFNPQAFPALKQAGLQIEESRLRVESQTSSTLYQVKQTYLQALVLDEQIELQHQNLKRNQRVLDDARSLFFQGKGLRVDTLRAYTAVRNLEPDLLKLSFAKETSLLNLKALLGLDSLQAIVLTDSLFLVDSSEIPDEAEVYVLAKANNPDFRLLELQQQVSDQQLSIASAARMPSVAAVAQYQLQSQTNNFEYGNAYYPSASFVGLQLSVPLFNGMSNHAKVKQAALTKTQTVLQAELAYEQLRAAAHQAVSNSKESRVRVETTAAVEQTAKLSYNITEYRYKRGVSSRLELADASLELSTAQSNFLEAVYDYLLARITLQHLMGRVEK